MKRMLIGILIVSFSLAFSSCDVTDGFPEEFCIKFTNTPSEFPFSDNEVVKFTKDGSVYDMVNSDGETIGTLTPKIGVIGPNGSGSASAEWQLGRDGPSGVCTSNTNGINQWTPDDGPTGIFEFVECS